MRSIEDVVRWLRRAVVREVENLNRLISHTLLAGVVSSVLVVAAGIAWSLLSARGLPEASAPVSRLLPGLLSADPGAIVALGILILVLTPMARVVLSGVFFAVERERVYVAIALIVLANLLIGFTFGIG